MATYPIINKETGEQKEIVLSIHEWPKWCEDNSDWIRDWSDPSTCPRPAEVVNGEINLWQEILDGMKF